MHPHLPTRSVPADLNWEVEKKKRAEKVGEDIGGLKICHHFDPSESHRMRVRAQPWILRMKDDLPLTTLTAVRFHAETYGRRPTDKRAMIEPMTRLASQVIKSKECGTF